MCDSCNLTCLTQNYLGQLDTAPTQLYTLVMDSVMDPLAVKSEQFTLEKDLDTKWAVLANIIVKEPTNTEEADAKVKEFKDTVKEKFPNTNIDDILTNKQGFRYIIYN